MIMTVVLDIRRVVADVSKNIGLKCHVHISTCAGSIIQGTTHPGKPGKIVEFDIFHALNIQEFRQRSGKILLFLVWFITVRTLLLNTQGSTNLLHNSCQLFFVC